MVVINLQEWQRNWVEDDSRFKILAASRQVGKSFIMSLDDTMECIEKPSNLEILLSASDKQSLELAEKVKAHAYAMNCATEGSTDFFQDTSITLHKITFPNRSRVIAVAANPDTARGFSGNISLDEYAIHKDPIPIWKAAMGIAMRGFKLRVASTFKGKKGKFFEVAKEVGLAEGVAPSPNPIKSGVWSGHWCNIHMADQQGLTDPQGNRLDIEGLRAAVGDEDVWAEEFCNIPTDSAAEFISKDLVMSCESPAASIEWDGETRPDLYFGFDVARKRDLSVIWIVERLEDGTCLTRGVIRMLRVPFAEQERIAREVAKSCARGCIDATGIGAQLAENLRFASAGQVEPVQFNASNKETMAVQMKTMMESHKLLIPEDVSIRRSIQAVKQYVGATGGARFDADRTASGHADEFWACAMALSAAQTSASYVPASEGGLKSDSALKGMSGRKF